MQHLIIHCFRISSKYYYLQLNVLILHGLSWSIFKCLKNLTKVKHLCTSRYKALWKITQFEIFFSKCIKFGIKSANFEKKNRKSNLHSLLYFSCLKCSTKIIDYESESISSNVLLTNLLVVRSFVRSLKNYCRDKRGLHRAN